jgi:hypothetical protein
MARSNFIVQKLGNLTLQAIFDPEDIFYRDFKMDKREILYKNDYLMTIEIFNDVNDYIVTWNGRVPYDIFLETSKDIDERVHRRAKAWGIYEPERYVGHFFFPHGSRHQDLSDPFNVLYHGNLMDEGMIFLRLDMPYFDVMADLVPRPRELQVKAAWEGGGDIGITSFYSIPQEIAFFFLRTKGLTEMFSQNDREDLVTLLSRALETFGRL